MKADRRREIKRRLREIKRDPASAAPGEAQHLTAEYRRLQSAERAPAADQPERPLSDTLLPEGLTGADRAAVGTWPPELRSRLHDRALTRQILPWRAEPDGAPAPPGLHAHYQLP
ncbi:hypothetical protein [Streptomyces sp. 351MFTsu5.1]|uniref:hypothetical protein n=1 Tax=Streptomyces sp. 351MFTsu5.1 TaxID=1172180 RepID=UPI00036F6282|nr:hypothetical protein [Streptomyces sp. 351MFTsu5.1]